MYAVRKDGLGWRAISSADDVTDEETFSETEPLPKEKKLDDFKADKLIEIRDAYKVAEIADVEVLGIDWNGGFDSAIKLDAARRLSEAAGAPGVEFFDVSNAGHQLSFADALLVCITVASVYQNTLSKKQRLFKEVEAVQLSESMTETQAIAAVQAIVW